jgi:IS30 family transposase
VAKRRWRRITVEVRREIIRASARGATYEEIAALVGRSTGSVFNVLRPLGGVVREEDWRASPARLSVEDRVEIRLGLERGESYAAIGRAVGRDRSTIQREVTGNGGREGYRPVAAARAARCRARRPKPRKLAVHPALAVRVAADLAGLWSPQQIAARLRAEFGDDRAMRVSHETIYKTLYVQGRGELRHELAACLRTGRAKRRPRGRVATPGRIPGMVMISERPAEVADRAVPGHWEGDLIIGKGGRSAIGTLVERSTRYVMLLHLPGDRSADTVRAAMTATIQTLPAALRRSITWDQGVEMAQHATFPRRHRRHRLLLRPPLALAARLKREHQRPAPPVLPQKHRPVHPRPRRPASRRRQPQRPPSPNPRMDDTLRETQRTRCNDRLRTPSDLLQSWGWPGLPGRVASPAAASSRQSAASRTVRPSGSFVASTSVTSIAFTRGSLPAR